MPQGFHTRQALLRGGGTGPTKGVNIVNDPLHGGDYHGTIRHVLDLDHRKVTYRYAGRDFRLSDVDCPVIAPILC